MPRKILSDTERQERAELSKAIKRINERLAEMERQGLTKSSEYEHVKSIVLATPHKEFGTDEDGNTTHRIINTSKLTTAQKRAIMRESENKEHTAGAIKNKTRKWLKNEGIKPTKENVAKYSKMWAELHQVIQENIFAIYGHETLNDAVHRAWGEPLTMSEVETLYNDIVNNPDKKRELERTYYNSINNSNISDVSVIY